MSPLPGFMYDDVLVELPAEQQYTPNHHGLVLPRFQS